MPAEHFAERAADQRRQERADIDADIEDGEGAVAPRIAGRVEPADLGGDIRLEGAVAEDQRAECKQEQLLDRHQEMADRHEDRAEYYGAALSQDAIGEETAENRRQIDERRVEPVDLRRQGLQIERTEYRFERALDAREAEHVPGLLGREQMLRHVENEQRAHPVVGEALPHLGGEQEGEAPRVAEKVRLGGARSLKGELRNANVFSQDGRLRHSQCRQT